MTIAPLLLVAMASTAPLPPVVYEAATRDYDVRLRIAPELKVVPAAYAALQAGVERDFTAFESSAAKDMAQWRSDSPNGPMARNPEVERVQIDFVVRTPHLIGFVRRDYRDAHGAHGSYVISGMLFDLESGQRMSASDVLRSNIDMGFLNAALATRASAEKKSRGIPEGLEDGFVKPGQMTWKADFGLAAGYADAPPPAKPDRRENRLVVATLVASSSSDKAAGLQFLYSPYDIGSFAEGGYRVVLPWRVFSAELKPIYRQDFGGTPVGDLAPDPLAKFPADVPAFKP